MTGYELTSRWYEFKFENPALVRHIHSDMFFYVVYLWNKLGRKKEFGLPTEATMESLSIGSYNTYKNTLNDLIAFGAIRLVKDSKNQHHAKIVALSFFDEADNKASDKAKVGLSNFDEATDNPTDEACDEATDTIDKELKNRSKEESKGDISLVGDVAVPQKTQEETTPPPPKKAPLSQKYSEDYEAFWKLYDKADAGGKKQCYEKWVKLPIEEKSLIMMQVKDYKKKQPDSQYRKNPITYFNQKPWEDFVPNAIVKKAEPKMVY